MPPIPKTSRVSKRSKGREKCRMRSRSLSPAAASIPESEASHATSEAPVTGRAEVQDSDDTDRSSLASQKTKKAKVLTDLTKEEEESMVEWLEAFPILYNKKLQAYKDTAKKEWLWMEKATEMGKSVLVLKTWYTSLRSRFGRLKKKRSGDEATEAEMTERDLWIVRRFEFLCPHIREVQKKTTVCMKQKFAAASATSTAASMVEEQDDNDTSRTPPAHTPSSVVSFTPRSRQKQISTEAEEALLTGLVERSHQMMALQQQVMDKLKPSADREREAFVDWTSSVILDLDHGIWRRCQHDISQILYKYIGENDQLKRQAASFHSAVPTPSITQFRKPIQSFSGSSSASSAMWQSPLLQWST